MSYLLNGEAVASICASDRGLQYGDGVFETLLWQDSNPVFFHDHYQRLSDGCRRLGFTAPAEDVLLQECHQLAQGRAAAVIKIIVTRGCGGRGYRPPAQANVNRLVSLHDLPSYPEDLKHRGARLIVCNTRLGRNASLAGIKHLNRLEQVLAQAEFSSDVGASSSSLPEASDAIPVAHEGLMLDEQGLVIEATMSNVHIVESGCISTPRLQFSGVNGIIRAKVRLLAKKLEIPWQEDDITLNRVFSADEVFISNSIIGIWPVCQLMEREFVAMGTAMTLQSELAEMMETQ